MKKYCIAALLLAALSFGHAGTRIDFGARAAQFAGTDLRGYMTGGAVELAAAKKLHGLFSLRGGCSADILAGEGQRRETLSVFIAAFCGPEASLGFGNGAAGRLSACAGVAWTAAGARGPILYFDGDLSAGFPVTRYYEAGPALGFRWYATYVNNPVQLIELRAGIRISYRADDL
jgi:hypothetical protein